MVSQKHEESIVQHPPSPPLRVLNTDSAHWHSQECFLNNIIFSFKFGSFVPNSLLFIIRIRGMGCSQKIGLLYLRLFSSDALLPPSHNHHHNYWRLLAKWD